MKVVSDSGWVKKKTKYSFAGRPINEWERVRFIETSHKEPKQKAPSEGKEEK